MIDGAALVARLDALSDAERLAFARWAHGRQIPLVPPAEWGGDYVARSTAETAAVAAFDALRRDGTVPEPWPWEFFFDPCFPETGWDAWRDASGCVRAMAAALAARDEGAVEVLSPAFEALGLAADYSRPGK